MGTRWIALMLAAAAAPAGMAAPAAAAAAAAQPGAAGIRVTSEFLVGRWTDNGDCSQVILFMSDGRFVVPTGGRGQWSLAGDRLTFSGDAGSRTVIVRAPDRDTIRLTHPDGSEGGSTRCAPPARFAMPAAPGSVAEAIRISAPVAAPFLFGRWTDTGNCAADNIEFLSDGRFLIDNGEGRWTLTGERLTFSAQSTIAARVRRVGPDRILLIHDDGSIGQSARC